MQSTPLNSGEREIYMTLFLCRTIKILRGHSITVDFTDQPRSGWKFLVEAGELFLEELFPAIPQFAMPPVNGYEAEPGWLEDMAGQLCLHVPRAD